MALIVQKFGGTSVGNMERIRNVAKRVARTFSEGNEVVVVLSAMSGETNRLVGLCHEASHRRQTEFPCTRVGHHHEGGRAVVHGRGVAGCHRAVRLEGRP